MIRFAEGSISFLDSLFFPGSLFGRMESINVADILQEAGDANSRARIRSQVRIEYNIIPYTSTPITLPHLCQGYHDHCIVTSSDGGDGKVGGWFIYVRVWVGGQGVGIIFCTIFCSVFVLLLIVLSWLVHDSLLHLFHSSVFAFFVSGLFN